MKDIRGLATREREFYRREDARRKAKAKADSPLEWRRDGDDWVLLAGRRRLGRVVPDPKYSRMWSSVKSGGQLSDMANLSWAKNAVLIAAEHELEWEARERPAIDPSKCPEKGGVSGEDSPPVRSFHEAAE